jgi:hypothetical protein
MKHGMLDVRGAKNATSEHSKPTTVNKNA